MIEFARKGRELTQGILFAAALLLDKEAQYMSQLCKLMRDDSGQDLIEYALLAGFISIVAVVAITSVGTGVNTVYGGINTQVALIPAP